MTVTHTVINNVAHPQLFECRKRSLIKTAPVFKNAERKINAAATAITSHAIASASLAAVAAAAVFYVLRRRRIARVVELRSAFLCEVARTRLPAPFDSWEDICEQLPCLNKQRTIRSVIDSTLKVHRVVHSDLTLAQVRRARVMLGCMIASYVNGEQVPWEHLEQDVGLTEGVYPWYRLRNGHDEHTSAAQSPATAIDVEAQDPIQLPPSLGVPWRDVSEMLGLPPILTATDLDLWNRGGTDVSQSPRDALRGFRQMVSITGTRSERGFHACRSRCSLSSRHSSHRCSLCPISSLAAIPWPCSACVRKSTLPSRMR